MYRNKPRQTEEFTDIRKEIKGRHPIRGYREQTFPIRTATAAILLFGCGTILLLVGLQIFRTEFDRGLSLIILGSLAFLPGFYATYMLYGAWRGWKGFSYGQVPSYDE